MIPIINQVYLTSLDWFFNFVERVYRFIMSYKKNKISSQPKILKNVKLINKKPFSSYKIIKKKTM
jgi:hypothetical protein